MKMMRAVMMIGLPQRKMMIRLTFPEWACMQSCDTDLLKMHFSGQNVA